MRTLLIPALLGLLAACNTPVTPPEPPPAPPTTIPLVQEETLEARQERGRYLVEIMGCNDCHSPKLMGPNGPYPDPDRLLSGHPAAQALPAVPKAALATFRRDAAKALGELPPWSSGVVSQVAPRGRASAH